MHPTAHSSLRTWNYISRIVNNEHLILQGQAVTLHTKTFTFKNSSAISTDCNYVSFMDPRANSDYFPIQRKLIDVYYAVRNDALNMF